MARVNVTGQSKRKMPERKISKQTVSKKPQRNVATLGKPTPKGTASKGKASLIGVRNKSVTPCSMGRRVLGQIKKPHRIRASKEQKEFFRRFIKRLEERDKDLYEKENMDGTTDANQQPVTLVSSDLNVEWEVEEIIDVATKKGELLFMVLWKGYMLRECTWETQSAMAKNCQEAIDDFYAAFPKKAGAPKVQPNDETGPDEAHEQEAEAQEAGDNAAGEGEDKVKEADEDDAEVEDAGEVNAEEDEDEEIEDEDK